MHLSISPSHKICVEVAADIFSFILENLFYKLYNLQEILEYFCRYFPNQDSFFYNGNGKVYNIQNFPGISRWVDHDIKSTVQNPYVSTLPSGEPRVVWSRYIFCHFVNVNIAIHPNMGLVAEDGDDNVNTMTTLTYLMKYKFVNTYFFRPIAY